MEKISRSLPPAARLKLPLMIFSRFTADLGRVALLSAFIGPRPGRAAVGVASGRGGTSVSAAHSQLSRKLITGLAFTLTEGKQTYRPEL